MKKFILIISTLFPVSSIFSMNMNIDDISEQIKKEIVGKLESAGIYSALSNLILDYVDLKPFILNTMLLDAAKNLDTKAVYKLVKMGADTTAQDKKGNTAYDYIRREYGNIYGSGSRVSEHDVPELEKYANLMEFLKQN